MPMSTAQDVLRVAQSQVGYSRWDDPKQGTKYGRWYAELVGESYYGQSGVAYCAMFVSWVFAQAGAKCAGLPGAYCPSMLAIAKRSGATVPVSSATAGDVVYFDWGSDGESDHVGIVVENRGSYLVTIEGNTSATSNGSQVNGGVVARKERSYSQVCGVVRPIYTATDSDTTKRLEITGRLVKADIAEWQRQCGTLVDGVVSGQFKDARQSFPALESVTFEGSGSALMQEVQTRLGVYNPTGMIFVRTVELLQGRLIGWGYSCIGDAVGVLGEATAKAIQQSLNDRRWSQ